jgi:hypothetical protein
MYLFRDETADRLIGVNEYAGNWNYPARQPIRDKDPNPAPRQVAW